MSFYCFPVHTDLMCELPVISNRPTMPDEPDVCFLLQMYLASGGMESSISFSTSFGFSIWSRLILLGTSETMRARKSVVERKRASAWISHAAEFGGDWRTEKTTFQVEAFGARAAILLSIVTWYEVGQWTPQMAVLSWESAESYDSNLMGGPHLSVSSWHMLDIPSLLRFWRISSSTPGPHAGLGIAAAQGPLRRASAERHERNGGAAGLTALGSDGRGSSGWVVVFWEVVDLQYICRFQEPKTSKTNSLEY